jgi:hypothetical protein
MLLTTVRTAIITPFGCTPGIHRMAGAELVTSTFPIGSNKNSDSFLVELFYTGPPESAVEAEFLPCFPTCTKKFQK